ncbi:MAG: HEPN domain-containing protein [Candidatus Goldbacteria bacterium]|nr:HEPN domain-containing protein [Candidatus Goldiibacteriota bacterium]
MKKITQEWINKAENDFKVCLKELKSDEPIWDAICFHSQQCVEKYLKAILQENNIYFEKTHDLGTLAQKCKNHIKISNDTLNKLEFLSEYAVEIRYPGIESSNEEAEKSFEICNELRKIIRNYFKLETNEK